MKEVIGFVGGFLVLMGSFLHGVFWLSAESNFPSSLAKIEQLRYDSQLVDIQASEDVAGQIAEWNQIIRSNQQYNKMFLAQLYVPDGWDDVKLIEIGR